MNHIITNARAFAGAFFAAMLLLFSVAPSFAIYNDQTRNFPSRIINTEQVVEYYRVTINWNDSNIATAQKFGGLPANAYILSIDADVTTAFNAATTNYIAMGVSTASTEIIAATGLSVGSTGVQHLTSAAGLGVAITGNSTYTGIPTTLYAKYIQTGTAATAGAVTIVIAYVPNGDQ
jgi:hypothetical protein